MLKILIICKNFSTAKQITNKILFNVNEFQIVGITDDLNEVKELLESTEADFVITTNAKIVEQLLEDNLVFYEPKIILITNATIISYNPNLLVLNYNLSFQDMSKVISTFINKEVTMSKREMVADLLAKLGFDFKLSGTIYILDSILYASSYKGAYSFEKLERDIYSYVAELNNKDTNKIKWSIARSINYMYKRHTEDTYQLVEKYFGLKYPERPTPKLVISLLTNILE